MKWLKTTQLYRRLLFVIFLLFVFGASNVMPLAAQEPQIQSLRQEDLDGDGQPDLTVIRAAIQTPADEVRIYDGAGNMAIGQDWQSTTDFEDDTWVFDTLADGSAQLVLKFSRVGETVTAQLFIDQSGDSIVDVEVDGTNVHVQESPYPSLTVTAQGDWFLPDGQLNWNVLFETDGPIVHLHTYNLTDAWNRGGFIKHDGKPDIEVEFRDKEGDGIPEYGWWRLLAPTPGSWGAVRTWIWGNEGNHRPVQPTDFVFWPYLISENYDSPLEGGRAVSSGRNYFDVPPGISFAFGAGQIRSFFFPGYPIEQGFHVNTLEYFEDFEANYTNFENMQGYYDLANDNDNAPELHIRHRYYAGGDDYGWNLKSPVNGIRWSWNQMNEPDIVWDYRLGLAGRHVLTTEMQLPDFSFTTIPYDELPTWVTTQQWDYGTFVSSEKQPLHSTEGIYTWGAVETVAEGEPSTLSRYLAGEVAIDLEQAFQNIALGWRGELAPDLKDQPYLYFSPIDHKLHLVKATHGIWNIDNHFAIRYADHDADGYLDQWQYLELPPDEPVDDTLTEEELALDTELPFDTELALEPQPAPVVLQELTLANGYFIYADRAEKLVLLKQATPPQSAFEVLPPRNHQEWQILNEQLEANQHEFAPDDLQGMMAQFDGPVSQIKEATLRDFRLQGEGFRFILELQAGASSAGENLLNLTTLEEGSFIVTSFDGVFRIEELTPPEIELDINIPENDLLGETQPRLIRLKASNIGLEDAKGLTLVVEAKGREGQARTEGALDVEEVGRQTIDLLSGEPKFVPLTWQPSAPGDWELHFSLYDSGAEENRVESMVIVAEKSHVVTIPFDEVSANQEQSLMALLTSFDTQRFSVPALLAFPASMILALFLVSRRKESI